MGQREREGRAEATAQPPPGRRSALADRVVLRGISWATYESLRADSPESQTPRLAYFRGALEVVVTLFSSHERDIATLSSLVGLVTEAWDIDTRDIRAATVQRRDLQVALEPDTSIYVRPAGPLRSPGYLDLTVDPPPTLAIEVDRGAPALPKLPIYAALGIPEVWRVADGRVTLHVLAADGDYRAVPASTALPPLTAEILTRFLAQSRSLGSVAWRRGFRAWAQEQAGGTLGPAAEDPETSPQGLGESSTG